MMKKFGPCLRGGLRPRRKTTTQSACRTSDVKKLFAFSHVTVEKTVLLIRHRHSPSQADVKVFQALKGLPEPATYPYAYRWAKHIASYESEFASLPGDPSKEFTAYGPEASEVTINPAKAPAAAAEEEDEDVDLFGSDSEEEDPEAVKERERRLEEYKQKKAGKTKPAAKSIVTMDVKPWGTLGI